jgi:prepilin-type N-terminal cleavage/methylation domain-containing protein
MIMKKTNNAGFSLVELIVVIAIMAVLVGVLAPQLLRYVERSRVSTDNQAVAEVANAVKTAMADEVVYNKVKGVADGVEVTLGNASGSDDAPEFACDVEELLKEIQLTCGSGVSFKANCYAEEQPKIKVNVYDGNVVVTASPMCEVDGTEVKADSYSYVNGDGESVKTDAGVVVY